MPSKDWEGVKVILESLYKVQEAEWLSWEEREVKKLQNDLSPALKVKESIVSWRWNAINSAKLEALLEQEQLIKFTDEKLILFLPPFPKEERAFVPVASLEYNPANNCLQVRVGMFCLNDQHGVAGYGFRMESPTSNCSQSGTESEHDYFHIQMINNIGYGPSMHLPDWIPEIQPAFCIRAQNPVDGLLNLILSLYGLNYYKNFLKPIKSRIDTHAKLMRVFSK